MQRTVKFVAVEKRNMRAVFAVSVGDEKSSPVYSVRRTRDGGRERTVLAMQTSLRTQTFRRQTTGSGNHPGITDSYDFANAEERAILQRDCESGRAAAIYNLYAGVQGDVL